MPEDFPPLPKKSWKPCKKEREATQMNNSKLLSIGQVAEMLGIKYYAAQTLFHSQSFPRISIGKRLFVREESLQKFLDKAEKAC